MKYYAVAKGRQKGVYKTWEECKKQVDGYSGAIFKSFDNEADAKKYVAKKRSENNKVVRVCILCSKPLVNKGELCSSCKNRKKALQTLLFEYSNGSISKISNANLIHIKRVYKTNDVFSFLTDSPNKYWTAIYADKKEKQYHKREYKSQFKENMNYSSDAAIPQFVKTLLGPSKVALKVSGSKNNPHIIYYCKKCKETLYTRYNDYRIHSAHDCSAIKSSGELIVEEFLKKYNVKYKTQRDTLECINPDTGFVMPYDFELVGKKVLVEVQGDQHRKYIPRFHVTDDGFQYQLKKDRYKREFAISRGYKLIEIWYEDLEENRLRQIFEQIITE